MIRSGFICGETCLTKVSTPLVAGVGLGFYFYQQDGDFDLVLDSVGGGAQEEVGEEAVAVGAHGYEVALFFFDPLDDFGGRVAEG
jgi:hypothetical protein